MKKKIFDRLWLESNQLVFKGGISENTNHRVDIFVPERTIKTVAETSKASSRHNLP